MKQRGNDEVIGSDTAENDPESAGAVHKKKRRRRRRPGRKPEQAVSGE